MPQPRQSHPSLVRIYRDAEPDAQFLYFDETYTTPHEGLNENFYALTAVQYSFHDLPALRADLQDIAGSTFWHTTEALQTAEGNQKFEEFLDYFASEADPSFITCKVELEAHYKTEDARRDCMRKLLTEVCKSEVEGLVFEARNNTRDNNRDRAFIKRLREENLSGLPDKRAWVSPKDETALWVPDIVGMAYRRTRTHADRTSKYFEKYLAENSRVFEI